MGKSHFLCCLPIRLGAFFVALFSLLGSGIQAAFFALVLVDVHKDLQDGQAPTNRMTTGVEVNLGLVIFLYICLFLLSIYGLVGVINRRIDYITSFAQSLVYVFLFNLCIGVSQVIVYRKDQDQLCQNDTDTCKNTKRIVFIVMCAILGIWLLLQAYAIWILSDCVDYLAKRHEEMAHPFASRNAPMSVPADDSIPLTHGKESYSDST